MNIAIKVLRATANEQRDILTACMSEAAQSLVTGDVDLAAQYAPLIASTQDKIKELEQAIKILNYELNS